MTSRTLPQCQISWRTLQTTTPLIDSSLVLVDEIRRSATKRAAHRVAIVGPQTTTTTNHQPESEPDEEITSSGRRGEQGGGTPPSSSSEEEDDDDEEEEEEGEENTRADETKESGFNTTPPPPAAAADAAVSTSNQQIVYPFGRPNRLTSQLYLLSLYTAPHSRIRGWSCKIKEFLSRDGKEASRNGKAVDRDARQA